MTASRCALVLCAALSAGLFAGCGEASELNRAIDRGQEQVDRAQESVNDPVRAAERAAQERVDEALTPLREAERQVERATDVVRDPAAAARRAADRALEDAVSPEDQR